MFDISRQNIKFSCPKCNFQNTITLRQAKNQETVKCGRCKKDINLVDKDGSVNKIIDNVNSAIDNLNETIKKIKI